MTEHLVDIATAMVDVETAAAELGTSKKFIRDRIAAGDLTAVRLKGSKLIRISRLDLESLKLPYEPGQHLTPAMRDHLDNLKSR